MKLAELLKRLAGVRAVGSGQWSAHCPAHEDSTPSLSVGTGQDGRILVNCKTGCSVEEICEALGITQRDLFSTRQKGELSHEPCAAGIPSKVVEQFIPMMEAFRRCLTPANLDALSKTLGVDALALKRLDVGWDEKTKAYAFPMFDAQRQCIGIKRRFGNGDKKSIGGSREGLFIPRDLPTSGALMLAEGASDTAALLTLGFATVGRPSASTGVEMIIEFARSRSVDQEFIVVADNDDAGEKGAAMLATSLAEQGYRVKVIRPPTDGKDIREWTIAGATRADVEKKIASAPVVNVGGPVLVRLCDVQPKPVKWLWSQRIAQGKVSLLCGDPGLGKSFITVDWTARVTTGKNWPDGSRCSIGSVILISAEDDLADTIRPRLDAAGADVRKVVSLSAICDITNNGAVNERSFTLADIPALAKALRRQPDCKLVVIDPVSAYLLHTDSHNNAEVRTLLAPLAKLAADHGVAVVIVTHLNKGTGMSAMQRVTGSGAFVAASRAAYIVARDKNDPTGQRRLFLPLKNNLGNDTTGLAYNIENERIKWEPTTVNTTADDALASESSGGSRGPQQTERKEAIAWLKELLKRAPLPAKDVFQQADDAGYSKATINRAKQALSIKPSRTGFRGQWVWTLPKLAAGNRAIKPASQNLSILGKPEHLGVFEHKNGVAGNAELTKNAKVRKFYVGRPVSTNIPLSERIK